MTARPKNSSRVSERRYKQRLAELAELRTRYAEVYSEESHSRNRPHLIKRITWKLQEREHGGLSESARKRARERLPMPTSVFDHHGATWLASNVLLRRSGAPQTERVRDKASA